MRPIWERKEMADTDTATKPASSNAGIEIFRMADAPSLDESEHMELAGLTPEIEAGILSTAEAGSAEGNVVKTLMSRPGFSLTHAWFKSGFPLPLHTHNADCMYYITAGTLTLGTETLGAGDGFFVPRDKAYRYTPGPDGAEVLEFRHEENFDIKFLAKSATVWDKITAVVSERQASWQSEVPPSTKS